MLKYSVLKNLVVVELLWAFSEHKPGGGTTKVFDEKEDYSNVKSKAGNQKSDGRGCREGGIMVRLK